MDRRLSETPRLRWVLVEGNLCEVSEFRDLPPKARPQTICPICEQQVTLKLGQKRAHHFAHRPEDICIATKPETAMHLNCKFHIYRQLQAARKLYISTSCRSCGNRKPMLWKQDWDAVEVEYKMNSLRPDIALLQNGKVIGAIEIFVTHAVDEEKVRRLQSQGVDWIEVYGGEAIYAEPNMWIADNPLDTRRQHPDPPSWLCPQCEKAHERREYERNHREEILFARMIDLYFGSGKKYRHVFYVKQKFTNGAKTRIWIEDGDRRILADERAPITEQSHAGLNAKFRQKHLEFKQRATVVDDEMSWTPWVQGRKFVLRDIDNFPFRYIWHEDKKEWVLQPQLRWKNLG